MTRTTICADPGPQLDRSLLSGLGGRPLRVQLVLPAGESSATLEGLRRRLAQRDMVVTVGPLVQPGTVSTPDLPDAVVLRDPGAVDLEVLSLLRLARPDLAVLILGRQQGAEALTEQLLGCLSAPPALTAGRRVELELRRALDDGEFVLHYQPVADLRTGRVWGVEALVRWEHPDGFRMPDTFVPDAEDCGLIVPLGAWVLEQACQQGAAWAAAGLDLQIAVNLSARQVSHPGLLRALAGALNRSGLDPWRLTLEVTESAMLEDADLALTTLLKVREMGVTLAMDDFGTGYSSLLFLKQYPLQVVKIDRAFVAGLGRAHDDDAIVTSVISLARAIGASSIAEGVESMAQLRTLRAEGCLYAQGFLLSEAVPADDLPAALERCTAALTDPAGMAPRRSRRRRPQPGKQGMDPTVLARIGELHASGASLHTIAAALNREQPHRPGGLRWHSAAVAELIAALPDGRLSAHAS
jgi:EAL domain-containing protein (putative c-di-GMP-specific phosphodiesterase class I)